MACVEGALMGGWKVGRCRRNSRALPLLMFGHAVLILSFSSLDCLPPGQVAAAEASAVPEETFCRIVPDPAATLRPLTLRVDQPGRPPWPPARPISRPCLSLPSYPTCHEHRGVLTRRSRAPGRG